MSLEQVARIEIDSSSFQGLISCPAKETLGCRELAQLTRHRLECRAHTRDLDVGLMP